MKVFGSILASASASVFVHPHVHTRLQAAGLEKEGKSIECFFTCMGDLMRADIKCSFEFDYQSEEYYRCMEGPNQEFEACIQADGCIEADGTCINRCEPILLDDIDACEEGLASGELAYLDYVICMNTASLNFSKCWDDCTCEMPWCNCIPPSKAEKLSWLPYDVICYPDPEF
ncbi:Oidioi.mRNA.OKI2018_I69.PAR.g9019.t1.cds [Oikopleura dioica]|uniref:Oidioi.mRNA.OKI2018_I69.PAR.g9019.t1.cds n=1 Tax=Oikopleura dioica TaxID=34765 RepID=A0ABN7RJP9_OIKDI|nr:Oidioi.mRNA.OKI2018_I69.PAR.g9019.t1.cds [Oikopleura dioica]